MSNVISWLKAKIIKNLKLTIFVLIATSIILSIVNDWPVYASIILTVLYLILYGLLRTFTYLLETKFEMNHQSKVLEGAMEEKRRIISKDIRILKGQVQKNIERESLYLYRQLESLQALNNRLNFEKNPITGLRGWALSPDSALEVINIILDKKPKNLLELGSGTSTVLIGKALKINKSGSLISIDHSKRYADKTAKLVKRHGVEGHVMIKVQKLKPKLIKREEWLWYDLNAKDFESKLDFILVDGPPAGTQENARYPVIPVLDKVLNNGAKILLDDYDRDEEQEIVDRWLKEFPNYVLDIVETERQLAILTKQDS